MGKGAAEHAATAAVSVLEEVVTAEELFEEVRVRAASPTHMAAEYGMVITAATFILLPSAPNMDSTNKAVRALLLRPRDETQ